MAETVHKCDTLGKKHAEYNKLLKEALINSDKNKLQDLNFDELDIDNLLKIDIACSNRNVDHILKVLKSGDMLYVSKVIQKSMWLITEKQYENIINPDNLHDNLLPEMTTKASLKLKKCIIHNLVDESRVEYFYKKEKCPKTAVKWLLQCSVPFIEENIEKHCKHIKPRLIKRFCEKSISIFKILAKFILNRPFLTATMLLVYKHTDTYLDVLESASDNDYPVFNSRATKCVMKKCPERIINKFHIYANIIKIQIFAKYLQRDNIKSFLYKQVCEYFMNSNSSLRKFFYSDKILCIIRQLPKEEQFHFVKEVFIDKINLNNTNTPIPFDVSKMNALYYDNNKLPVHIWYQFATFEVAFEEIKKLISYESCQKNKNAMLLTLIKSAKHNLQYIQTLLKYYKEEHKNIDNSTKNIFIKNLMNQTNIYKFDEQTWTILNDIFKSMNVYEESNEDYQNCIIAVILYHVIHAKNIPEIIEKSFHFDTLACYCKTFNKEDKNLVFHYLQNYLLTKINAQNIINESDFKDALEFINNYLHLLLDWQKELLDHPLILTKIRKLIEIRQEHSWNFDLSSLYNIKKSWKKHMFDESLALYPSEKVCINALKHDPTLLYRYKIEVDLVRFNDQMPPQQLLSKMRIFWPQSLAANWINVYLEKLNMLDNHKTVIRGLCTLFLQKQLLNLIEKYAPQQEKINWSDIDELALSLQRQIAKNMHYARPQPGGDAVLLYAKGDYLNYALPSLLAIFYNMSVNRSREMITKLLNSRVSLQKHVIRFAFTKLPHEELKEVFSIIWKSSKNATIRCIIFNYTFNLLCSQKEDADIKRYFELLDFFIENLTSEEDKKIYNLFYKVDELPLTVRAKILMKSYKLLQRLIPNKANNKEYFDQIINSLAEYTRSVMDLISSDFATEIVETYLKERFLSYDEFVQSSYGMINVISAFFLSAKDEETQTERYLKVLRPLIQRCLNSWNEIHDGNYYVKKNLQSLLSTLRLDLKSYKEKINFEIIGYLFSNIQNDLKSLTLSENYIILTSWKLTVELTKLLNKIDINNEWEEISLKCAPEYGKICLEYMKTDVQTNFSCIYVLFVKALNVVIEDLFTEHGKLLIYESMLSDKEFMQAFLGVIKAFPDYISEEMETKANTIKKHLTTHPSVEVKMHYYNRFPLV